MKQKYTRTIVANMF